MRPHFNRFHRRRPGAAANTTVALPVYGERLAPVLDFADRMVVADIEDGCAVSRRGFEAGGLPPVRVARLIDNGVTVVVCGAVSNLLGMMLWHAGVELVAGITGGVEEVLEGYASGRLAESRFRLPGRFRPEGCRWGLRHNRGRGFGGGRHGRP